MCPEEWAGTDAWDDFLRDPNADQLRGIFNVATALFEQATIAFDAGAFPGATLLCRSALEAGLFVFMTRERGDQPEGSWYVVPPETLAGETRTVHLRELVEAVRQGEILSSEGLKGLERIQEHGDIVARLGSREDEVASGFRGSEGDVGLWITEEEALLNLQDASKILKRLAQVVREEPDKVGPQPRMRPIRVVTWIHMGSKKKGKPED